MATRCARAQSGVERTGTELGLEQSMTGMPNSLSWANAGVKLSPVTVGGQREWADAAIRGKGKGFSKEMTIEVNLNQ